MVSEKTIEALKDFFGDKEIDIEWMRLHTSIKCDKTSKSVTIEIDNMNDQEFDWICEYLEK